MNLKVSNTNAPVWRDITVYAELPAKLKCLDELAHNVWWSWNSDAKKLFHDIDTQLNKIRAFLENCAYQQTDIAHILYIIQNISYNKGRNAELSTLEAMIVRDADRLDALGAIGIIRTIEYGTSKGRPFYSSADLMDENTTLSHFYDKLFKLKKLIHTETARKMAEERDKFMHTFVEQFYKEIGVSEFMNSRSIQD